MMETRNFVRGDILGQCHPMGELYQKALGKFSRGQRFQWRGGPLACGFLQSYTSSFRAGALVKSGHPQRTSYTLNPSTAAGRHFKMSTEG
jgi:hypothetical protein